MEESLNFKVLIVDDVPKNIQVVGNILQEKNYDIYFANNGKTAISQAFNNNFDLILLDIMMPEMDGYQVCETLKKDERTKDVPIVFLTAKTDSESILKGFEVGGVDYVTKPFNGHELLARVKTHLALRESHQKLKYINQQLNQEIAERKQAEASLKQSEKDLRELNATKDKFFSIVAHDLKNPFNTLIGFTELLTSSYEHLTQEKVHNFHHLIHNAAKHGYNLLENLLEWSRAQTGRIKWNPEMIDLYKAIQGNIGLLKTTADNKAIRLATNVQKNTMVYADFNMVSTILRNLISNALKFTNTDGEVSASVEIKNDMAEITVADNGIGITNDDIDKLFRIDINHSTKGTAEEKGTGLGLILCKEFVEKNGGEIWVISQVGKGSAFKFTLPVAPPENITNNL